MLQSSGIGHEKIQSATGTFRARVTLNVPIGGGSVFNSKLLELFLQAMVAI